MIIVDNCLRPGQQIAVIANAIAVAIAKNLTPTEENVLGNLIAQVGSTLLAIAAIDEAVESSSTTDSGKNSNASSTAGSTSSSTAGSKQ